MPIITYFDVGGPIFTSEEEAAEYERMLAASGSQTVAKEIALENAFERLQVSQTKDIQPAETQESRCQKCGCGITLGHPCPACGERGYSQS